MAIEMDLEVLLGIVKSDEKCLALATAGSDDLAAARASEIVPKQLTKERWSYVGLSSVLPLDVLDRLITSVDLHIETNLQYAAVVKEMRVALRGDGIDVSHESTLSVLHSWAESTLPITEQDVEKIIDAVSKRPIITSQQITDLGLFNGST
jgi:hypothetical protein